MTDPGAARRRAVDVFVSPEGNAFMRDIAAWIAEAATLAGRSARLLSSGEVPVDPERHNLVVAPHEFFLLGDLDDRGIEHAASISVPVCTEQPGTPWFDIGAIATAASPLTLDINERGVMAFRARGRQVEHLPIGGVPSMVAPSVRRDVDVVFLGGETVRRTREIAALAPLLWDRRSEIRLFSFFRPVRDGAPGLVFGDDKYRLLARSRILVNVHRDDTTPGYAEWARLVEAMANGCCVVTEPVSNLGPFTDGEHLVVADDLAATVAELLDDTARCAAIGEAAREVALHEAPLASSLGAVLDRLDELEPATVGRRRLARIRPPRIRRNMIVAQRHPILPAYRANPGFRRRVYDALAAETELQRRIDRVRCRVRFGDEDHVTESTSEAYAEASPEVTVVLTLFGYADVVVETLTSIAVSEGVTIEIVVVDDHSLDDGRAVVERFMADHPELPMLLLGGDANRGLPAARNLGIGRARADKVMIMDADNLVYPTALRRLADRLDADPVAAFAYCTLEEFGHSTGLRSAMAWNVERLCDANYIDAQAMFRRRIWEQYGGYRTGDALVFGWEDWELLLRLAAAGEYGVHHPEMLGRYRTQEVSMIATTNLAADHMIEHVRELHPALPWPR